jgi:hypothetical protein
MKKYILLAVLALLAGATCMAFGLVWTSYVFTCIGLGCSLYSALLFIEQNEND